jgi:uncharacterized protein
VSMQVEALYTYPVKGCQALAHQSIAVNTKGLEGDRMFMVIDAHNVAVTLRERSEFLRVRPESRAGQTWIHAEGLAPYALPARAVGPRCEALLFEDHVVVAEDAPGSAWFSQLLATPVRLVSIAEGESRAASKRFPGHEVELTDAYPVTAVSTASLRELQTRVPTMTDLLQRFRANVVFSSDESFLEDRAPGLVLGDVSLKFAKRTSRCVIVDVHTQTFERGKQVLRELARFREEDNVVYFASNYLVQTPGRVGVGDRVEAR